MLPLLGEWHGEGSGGRRRPVDHRFGQWIRFSHDGRGFLAYESRTWRLTDDGAIVGPDVAGVRLLAAPRAGRRRAAGHQPRRAGRALRRHRPDDDELGAGHRRPGPHPGRARRHPRRPAVRHRRRRADVRDRPRRTRRTAAATDVRPTRTDPMTTAASRPPPRARSPTRYVDAVCDLDPIVATSLGTRPGDDRLPDPSPAGLRGRGGAGPRDAGRAGPGARRGPGAGRRPGRAPLRPAAARAAGRRARRARGRRGAARAVATCSARCTRSARSSA